MSDNIIIVQPCCCGQEHTNKDGELMPVHHEYSTPKGYCELCHCEKCNSIVNTYFVQIGHPEWQKDGHKN